MKRPRILIAGIGNIFFGDDAFGVEVARSLLRRTLPPHVQVKDFGIRGKSLTNHGQLQGAHRRSTGSGVADISNIRGRLSVLLSAHALPVRVNHEFAVFFGKRPAQRKRQNLQHCL